MVFADLSAPQATPNKPQMKNAPIAAISDRLIALLLDFLIFSPVISLLVAGFTKDARTFFLLDRISSEGLMAAGMAFVMGFAIFILLQIVFLYFWQATPGQFFMQMRVISFPHPRERLTLNQTILRSVLGTVGVFLLGLPFLEVISHPLRRAFHDRAADTLVVTLKVRADDGPMPLESRFVGSWLRMTFLFALLLGVIGFLKTYNSLIAGEFRSAPAPAPYACKEMPNVDLVGVARLDAALSLYLLNEISPECLNKEAEASLWGDPVHAQSLAYLAKYLVASGEEQRQYFTKVCEDDSATACILARFVKEDGSLQALTSEDQQLWISQLLLSEQKYAEANYTASLEIIDSLRNVTALKAGIEKRFVRAVWALQNSEAKNKGRTPASSEETQSWIKKFKHRYEVP